MEKRYDLSENIRQKAVKVREDKPPVVCLLTRKKQG